MYKKVIHFWRLQITTDRILFLSTTEPLCLEAERLDWVFVYFGYYFIAEVAHILG
jgi:hypothetical protein